jgi:uncharacterized membrane protein
MGLNWAEHTAEIEAPIETCFDAIVDYETFPRWQNAVDSVEVLDRHEDGLGRNVKLFVDAKVRKIDYTLDYSYDRPTRIEWDFVSGNGMRGVDGDYTFEELGPERTKATYRLGADPAIPVPGIVAKRVHRELVKRSVEDLKREAEQRHLAVEASVGEVDPGPAQAVESRDEELERLAAEDAPDLGRRRFGEDFRPEHQFEAPATVRAATPPPASGPEPASDSDGIAARAISVATNPIGTARGAVRLGVKTVRMAGRVGVATAEDLARRLDRRLSGDRDGEL